MERQTVIWLLVSLKIQFVGNKFNSDCQVQRLVIMRMRIRSRDHQDER